MHISEFGLAAYRGLPGLAFVADDVVLWAPSWHQMESAKRAGHSVLGAEDLLGLIEAGDFKVIGREHWLTEKSSRDHTKWPGAQWADSFDGRIAQIAADDENRPQAEKRVIFAKPEVGHDWAQDQLTERTPQVERVQAMVEADDALDPDRTRLLPGLAEKLSRLDPEARVEFALRDIRNHTLARTEAGAAVSVEPLAFREVVADLDGDDPGPRRPPDGLLPTQESLGELISLIVDLAAPTSGADVARLLAIKDRPWVRAEVDRLLFLADPRGQLESELDAELSRWLAAEFSPDGTIPIRLFDLVCVLIAILAEPAAALLPATIRLGWGLDEGDLRASLLKTDTPIPYMSRLLPFLLTHGNGDVTFARIGEVTERIRSGRRSG